MRVLDRKLLREIRSSGWLLAAITSIIAVGVAAYVALGSAYRNLSTGNDNYYAQCRMADFSVDVKKVPLAELAALTKIPGVSEIRPRIRFLATVDLDEVPDPINGLVLSLPDRREPVINDILLRQGGYFTDRRANEVIINDAFARNHRIHPGDWIHLLLNNRRQELYVVGTAISSEFTYLVGPGSIVPDSRHYGIFYIKHTYAEDTFDFAGAANEVVGRLAAPERANPDRVLRQIEQTLEPYGVFRVTPQRDQVSNRFLSNEINGLRAFGIINPAIFLSVAALVLNVLMSRLTEQQRVTVGTLKAVGYTEQQIMLHFVKFGLFLGFIGGLAGCVLAYWIAEGMTGLYRLFFQFPSLVNRFDFWSSVQGMAISLACTIWGSMQGARAVVRLLPAVAMRPKPPAKGGAIWLEHIGWFWRRTNFGWRMTLRGMVRNKVRTAAGVFAAAMGAAVTCNAIMLTRATDTMIDFQFQLVQRSDVDLAFREEHGRDALDEVRHLPGVSYAEPLLQVGCTFRHGSHSYKGGVTGLTPGARLTIPRTEDGRPVRITSTGITLTRKLARILHLEVGDRVSIEPVKGLREARETNVMQIVDSYVGVAADADIYYLSRLVQEEFAMNGAQLELDRTSDPDRRALNRQIKELPEVQSVVARQDSIDSVMNSLVKNQRVFIGLLVLFAGTIFFGSVLNASLIGLAERKREVATLRVLGYTEWQIGALFLRETGFTNLVGTLVGLPLGYALNVGITIAYDTEMFRIPVIDPRGVFLFTLVLGMVFGLSAQGFVQRLIHRMDWLEALKTKE